MADPSEPRLLKSASVPVMFYQRSQVIPLSYASHQIHHSPSAPCVTCKLRKKLKKLVLSPGTGIAPQNRAKVWLALTGADSNLELNNRRSSASASSQPFTYASNSRAKYETQLEDASTPLSPPPASSKDLDSDLYKHLLQQPSPVDKQIMLDVPRSAASDEAREYLGGPEQGIGALHRVLHAYSNYDVRSARLNVVYSQGLNFVAAMLLLNTKDEEASFRILVSLLRGPTVANSNASRSGVRPGLGLSCFFRPDHPALHLCCLALGELACQRYPALWLRFKKEGLGAESFGGIEWFTCLFSSSLQPDCCARLWDAFFFIASPTKYATRDFKWLLNYGDPVGGSPKTAAAQEQGNGFCACSPDVLDAGASSESSGSKLQQKEATPSMDKEKRRALIDMIAKRMEREMKKRDQDRSVAGGYGLGMTFLLAAACAVLDLIQEKLLKLESDQMLCSLSSAAKQVESDALISKTFEIFPFVFERAMRLQDELADAGISSDAREMYDMSNPKKSGSSKKDDCNIM